jgi:hypothetical protein
VSLIRRGSSPRGSADPGLAFRKRQTLPGFRKVSCICPRHKKASVFCTRAQKLSYILGGGPSTRFTVTTDDRNLSLGRDYIGSAGRSVYSVLLFSRRHSSKTMTISILKANYNAPLLYGRITMGGGDTIHKRLLTRVHAFNGLSTFNVQRSTRSHLAFEPEPKSSISYPSHTLPTHILPFNFPAQRFRDGIGDFGC